MNGESNPNIHPLQELSNYSCPHCSETLTIVWSFKKKDISVQKFKCDACLLFWFYESLNTPFWHASMLSRPFREEHLVVKCSCGEQQHFVRSTLAIDRISARKCYICESCKTLHS